MKISTEINETIKKTEKIKKLTKSKYGFMKRPTKLIHQIDQEKGHKLLTSIMKKRLSIQILQTLKH